MMFRSELRFHRGSAKSFFVESGDRRWRAARPGFSLVEVLVTISLVVALMGAMFGFLSNLFASRDRVKAHIARERAATMLLDRAEADLAACSVGDRALGAGVVGTSQRLRVITHGVGVWAATSPEARAGGLLGDLQVVEYRFDPQTRAILAGRGPLMVGAETSEGRASPLAAHARDTGSAKLASSPDAKTDSGAPGPALSSLGGTIGKVRFRFHDGTSWKSTFDSVEADRLPRAVEIAVWFHAQPDDAAPPQLPDEEETTLEGPTRRREFQPTFDEETHAKLGDARLREEPRPDRVRVVLIPDSQAEESPGSVQPAGGAS